MRIGINGFGRIGRLLLRLAGSRGDMEVVAVNDPFVPAEDMAYLLKYDTVHGRFPGEVMTADGSLLVNGRSIRCYACKAPAEIPWAEVGAELIVECTGKFNTVAEAGAHLRAGAKRVIISAPSPDAPMFVMGVNEDGYVPSMDVISNASCTTNCLAPLAKVVNERFGIRQGLMTTIHAATASQKTVDAASTKDRRAGRSVFGNIIPASTGAAKAVGKVIPALSGRLTGISMRVPSADVSVVDLTCELERDCSYEALCDELRRAGREELKGILTCTEEEVVSSDLIGDTHSCIFDVQAGLMLGARFVKLIAWYDNEAGYAARCLDLAAHVEAAGK